MIIMKKCFTLLLIALFGSFTFHDPESGILITNIKVVDTEKGEVRKNPKNIWIKGDSIWRVDNYKVPVSQDKNVIVIDGTGKYIIPGLWDMHAHPDDPEMWRMNPDDESRDLLLPLFVLHGVTGIRDMAGSMEVIRGWKKKIGQKTLLGPEIYACGPLIDGPNPMWDGSVGIANLARVKPVVDSLMNSGSDFLKVYSLLPDSTYFALSSYAKKLKIPFAGHVPLDVSTTSASDTGMKSQEHLLNLLIDCSSMADKIYDGSMDYEGITDPMAKYIYRNDLMLKTFNKRRAYEIFKVFVKNNTWHTPTISMWHSNAYFEENIKKDSAYFNYLPPYMRRYWDPGVNDHLQERYADILAVKKRLVKKYMEVIG